MGSCPGKKKFRWCRFLPLALCWQFRGRSYEKTVEQKKGTVCAGSVYSGSDDLYSFELSDDEVAPVDKAVGFQQGNDDLKAIVNEVVKEQTEAGNVDKWVTEYAKKAAEMGLNK